MKLKILAIVALAVVGVGAAFVALGGGLPTTAASTTKYLTSAATTGDVTDEVAATGSRRALSPDTQTKNPGRRNSDENALRVGGIKKDRVQAHSAGAGRHGRRLLLRQLGDQAAVRLAGSGWSP